MKRYRLTKNARTDIDAIYYRHESSRIAITHVFDGRRDPEEGLEGKQAIARLVVKLHPSPSTKSENLPTPISTT